MRNINLYYVVGVILAVLFLFTQTWKDKETVLNNMRYSNQIEFYERN